MFSLVLLVTRRLQKGRKHAHTLMFPIAHLDAGVLSGLLCFVKLFPQNIHSFLQVSPLSVLFFQFLLLGSKLRTQI